MKVGIIGGSSSQFGELWAISPRKLVTQTVNEALLLSGLKLSEIESVFIGNMLSGMLGGQENLGALFAEELGLTVPAFKIEGACASGGLAFHTASLGVLSGKYKTALVIGVEKMTDHKPEEAAEALMGAGSSQERASGLTFPGLYAMIARSHMQEFGTTEEDMAAVAVKNHYHGSLNPKAHFQYPTTIEKVLKSPAVSDPLKLLDCSPISDGASSIVLAESGIAKKKVKKPVWLAASCVATDTLGLSERKSLLTLNAAVKAAKIAYSESGLKPSDINIAEVHDCFTIAEIIALEDLGFFRKGKAAKAVVKQQLTLGHSRGLVVNTSGGLKACGHPVGATGVKQVVEVCEQLWGKSGKRQAGGVKTGLTHNVGGSGAVAVINILKI